MATTTVSIGSNQSIDTETPATSSGSGPSYTVTFDTTPTGISVGDIGFMDTEDAGGGNPSDYTFLVTAISGDDITLRYCTDTGGKGDASPVGLYDGTGTSSSPNQAVMVFKRAFSTITLFEAMVDDASPDYWGTTDDVIGECHADSTFTDSRVLFDEKQNLSSVTLTAISTERHGGTRGSGTSQVQIKPTAGSGHNNGIIEVDIDNFTIEWIDIDLDSLDGQNTNKAVLVKNNYDNCIVRNNIIHDKGGNPGNTGPFMVHFINAGAASDECYILNNIVYNVVETNNDGAFAINTNLMGGVAYIYNNTVYNVESAGSSKFANAYRYGNEASSVINIKNNIAAQLDADGVSTNERAYWKNAAGSTENASNNLSDTTTHSTYEAPGSNSLTDQDLSSDIKFVSTTGGSEDLHIQDDSVCVGAGTDLGTTNGVNIDIDGTTKSGEWSMGADFVESSTAGAAFLAFYTE